jgi:integrase
MEKLRGVYEKEPGSGIWWIRYTVDGRKRREKVGRRSDAITLLAKRQTEKLQKLKLPETFRKVILFSELLDDAIEHSEAENGERSTHELKLKIERIRPVWASRRADSITKQEIVRWLQSEKVARDWSIATTNRWQACFSLVFRVGIDNEKIATNPASRIRRKAEENHKLRFLTDEEEEKIRAVLASKHSTYLPAFLFSINTGLRASEQWRLHWTDIDLNRKQLTVRKQKSRKGERHVSLNPVALEALASLHHSSRDKGHVFLNSDGAPMKSHRDWFDPAVKVAGVQDYTWHCNRHTFASRLAMAAIDIRTIAQLMGHRTIQMSMRYAHLSPDHTLDAVNRIAKRAADTVADTEKLRTV